MRGQPQRNGCAALIVTTLALHLGACSDNDDQDRRGACSGDPVKITSECSDERLGQVTTTPPELRSEPREHYYIEGEFTGTDARFSLHCPLEGAYQGRLFQNTHPLLGSLLSIPPESVPFALDSGACFLWTNQGGEDNATSPEDTQEPGFEPSYGGYRVNAAAMLAAKQVARDLYGDHEPRAYLYGGSGGAYQTVCSAEHTEGIWDGFVPFVMGTPHAIPNLFTVRIHALRILRLRDKFPQIMDAIDPGGTGDPYATLNQQEAEALREVTLMGFPPRGWWNHPTLNGGPLALIAGYVPIYDPTYTEDYFSQPGYLGFDDPYGSVAAARIQDPVGAREVVAVQSGTLVLDTLPEGDLVGSELFVDTGAEAGKQGTIFSSSPGSTAVFVLGIDAGRVSPGDQVRIDNSANLALQTFHRHQVPDSEAFVGWNQFRGSDGKPIYPQREVLTGPQGALNGAGCITSGEFAAPVILVQNLMDIDAFPWQADWYYDTVREVQGDTHVQRFRLWYIDHAQHNSPAPANTAAFARTISYQSVLQHALLDLARWVESGEPPAGTSRYQVVDSQVEVPAEAAQRRGIQPVVDFQVNGGERAEVSVGEEVVFDLFVESPPESGTLVQLEWDFLGVGDFPYSATLDGTQTRATRQRSHIYTEPGTYFAVARATQQRDGEPDNPHARVQNLGRVRVVVSPE
ncbi:hypothetical protein E4634_06780 [Mangrovimicrobium sediminis]|uniref:PKD domain-containing protein n=1 Tax=Mangrovimicrobium sediminis TaxID=2562682 RepID=A0A4Z0M5F2_9GAMM|nr:hypothetical protein [Haliea sp. SAOS-164]TGD74892.1 hypothetical protein E4634_06780 [Haliea sp. SAOS-164]